MNMEFKNLLSCIPKQQITECYKYRKPDYNSKERNTETYMNKVELAAINEVVNKRLVDESSEVGVRSINTVNRNLGGQIGPFVDEVEKLLELLARLAEARDATAMKNCLELSMQSKILNSVYDKKKKNNIIDSVKKIAENLNKNVYSSLVGRMAIDKNKENDNTQKGNENEQARN